MYMLVGNADGTGDGVMVANDDEALAHEYCSQGVPVDFTVATGQSHTDAAIPFEAAALPYLDGLLAGGTAPSSCSTVTKGNSIAPLPIPCPFAGGRLHGHTLAGVQLGETRRGVRRAHRGHVASRGHRNEQFLCLQPSSVRVVYPNAKVLAKMPSGDRAAMRGRVAWVSSADSRYALRHVRAGTKLASARRRLHLGQPFRVGKNRWYFAHAGHVLAVLDSPKREDPGVRDRVPCAGAQSTPRSGLPSQLQVNL